MNPDTTLLNVKDVRFSYEGVLQVLKGVSLSVDSGEVVTLLGPNGTGKTTLLKIIMGMIHPSSGEVRIFGEPITNYSRSQLAKLVGWVPQSEYIAFPYTVEEYILFGRTPHLGLMPVITSLDREVVDEIIEELGIPHLRRREVTKLSGGEAQLVRIGRALAQQPRLLILDEPTSHLDLRNSTKVLEIIHYLAKKRELGVLFTTHNPNEPVLAADRVYMLSEGRVVKEGTPQEVINPEIIKEVYGVEVLVHRIDSSFAVIPKPFRREEA